MIRAFASVVSNCSCQLCFARTQLVLVAALLVFPTAYATAQPGPASAQTSLTCGAYTANQPSLRQEGTTEAAGDILISCTGPLSASQTGKQTLSLIVSGTAITSRQLYKGTAPASIPTEAALLIDDCTVNTGTSSTGASCSPSGTYLVGNPIQGFLQADGSMLFSGITLPADGNPFTIRVTNIRVNANELTAGAFVTGTLMRSFPVQNQSGLVLGAVLNSLSLTVSAVTPFSQCASIPAAGTVVQTVTVKELFKTAFNCMRQRNYRVDRGGSLD